MLIPIACNFIGCDRNIAQRQNLKVFGLLHLYSEEYAEESIIYFLLAALMLFIIIHVLEFLFYNAHTATL